MNQVIKRFNYLTKETRRRRKEIPEDIRVNPTSTIKKVITYHAWVAEMEQLARVLDNSRV